MSLKTFHLVFVTLSTLLTLGFGVWAFRDYTRSGEVGSAAVAVVSWAFGAVLPLYGRWVMQKLKGVSWL